MKIQVEWWAAFIYELLQRIFRAPQAYFDGIRQFRTKRHWHEQSLRAWGRSAARQGKLLYMLGRHTVSHAASWNWERWADIAPYG